MEIWKDVKGYEGDYQVSNLGNVKSLKYGKERLLKPRLSTRGYLEVRLSKQGMVKGKSVHQMVAVNFLNHVPCGMKLVVNHINIIQTDNRVENLEITTQRYNSNRRHIKSSSKYTGVYWLKNRNKWRARITVNGKMKSLGCYQNEFDAFIAYQNALSLLNE